MACGGPSQGQVGGGVAGLLRYLAVRQPDQRQQLEQAVHRLLTESSLETVVTQLHWLVEPYPTLAIPIISSKPSFGVSEVITTEAGCEISLTVPGGALLCSNHAFPQLQDARRPTAVCGLAEWWPRRSYSGRASCQHGVPSCHN